MLFKVDVFFYVHVNVPKIETLLLCHTSCCVDKIFEQTLIIFHIPKHNTDVLVLNIYTTYIVSLSFSQ